MCYNYISKGGANMIKLPKLPHGQGVFSIVNNETVEFRKTIKLKNGNSVRKAVYAETPKKCMEKMAELEKFLNQQVKAPNRMVLIDAITQWLENTHKETVKPQTYRRLVGTANNQIEPSAIGHIRYQDVTSDEIQELLNKLNQDQYSHSTIKKTHDLLNAFYRYASEKDSFKNPMLLVNMPKVSNIKAEQKDIEWLEEDEIDRFVNACNTSFNNGNPKFKYGYILAANIYLGMRGGELLALQWQDIDFINNSIYVSKTLIEAENQDYDKNDPERMKNLGIKRTRFYVQENTKTSKNRYVPINTKAKNLLLKYKNHSQYTEPDDYVISTSNRKTNTLKNLSDAIKAIEQEADIHKSCNTHILRHTCASLYFKKGVPIEIICQILGNSREVCEKTYIHFVEEQLKDAASKLDVIEI